MSKSSIHNPTNFAPDHYEVENYLDNRRPVYCGGTTAEWTREVSLWEQDMERTLGPDWRNKMDRCIHCGNTNVRWITAVRHVPTNEMVVFGADCTKRLGFADRFAFKLAQLQAKAEARRVSFLVWTKRQAFLTAHPEMRLALDKASDPIHANNGFVQDVLAKLDKYGELSDKQVNAVVTSMERDLSYAVRRASEDAGPKGLAPTGRVEVTGTVLSTKWVENDFGSTQKMLVKLENNSKVWVSVPSRETIERGDTITFKATFTQSKDDTAFAFGSRPTLVRRQSVIEDDSDPMEANETLADFE